ncbi:hypothetical protein S40288_11562 [Stachybotrys chartarum IBT 40288]|nr:hypothetical protein S40288_11562 [Stachybotrys chartarum IBT 40288]
MPEGYDTIGRDATLGLGEPDKMRRPPISRRADPPRGSALEGVRVGSPDGPAVGAGHDGVPAREVLRGRGAGMAAGQHADARKAEFREPLLLTSNCGVAVHDGAGAGPAAQRRLRSRQADGRGGQASLGSREECEAGVGAAGRAGAGGGGREVGEGGGGCRRRTGQERGDILRGYGGRARGPGTARTADREDKDTTTTFAEGQGDGDSKHHALRRDADEATTVLADLLDKPRNVLEEIFGLPPESQYVEKTGRWIPRGQPGLGWLWCGDDVGNHAWVGINGHVCIGEEMSIWLFPVVEAM